MNTLEVVEEEFMLKEKWRRDVSNKLNMLNKQQCTLANFMDEVRVLESKEKKSVSDSILIKGQIDLMEHESPGEPNVIIKLFFNSTDPYKNSLVVEEQIYRQVLSLLYYNKHTPNLVPYLGSFVCNTGNLKVIEQSPFTEDLYDDEELELKQQINKLKFQRYKKRLFDGLTTIYQEKNKYNERQANLLVLEYSKGIPLYQWLATHSNEDVFDVVFQILYTLTCFYNFGLKHNDLHFFNILIEELEEPKTLYFKFHPNNKYVIKLHTKFIPKIFDFDRSSIIGFGVSRNLTLDRDYCIPYGECNNNDNLKYDIYEFLILLENRLRQTHFSIDFYNFIAKCIDFNYVHRPDVKLDSRPHLLTHTQRPTDKEIANPRLCLDILLNNMVWTEFTPNYDVIIDINQIPDKENIYTLPLKKTIKYEKFIPTSNGHSFGYILNKDMPKITPDDLNILNIWSYELEPHNYNIIDNGLKLLKELETRLTQLDTKTKELYLYAASILVSPQYYELDVNTRENMFLEFKIFIDNIWAIFGQRIPIEVLQRVVE